MFYNLELPSISKKLRKIVAKTLKGICTKMCITEDIYYAIICVVGSWSKLRKEKKRKCYDCIQRNTMQQVEANLPAPISNMSVSLKHSDVS